MPEADGGDGTAVALSEEAIVRLITEKVDVAVGDAERREKSLDKKLKEAERVIAEQAKALQAARDASASKMDAPKA